MHAPNRLQSQLAHVRVGGVVVLALLGAMILPRPAHGIEARALQQQVRAYREKHEHTILREMMDLLAIPNIASDSVHIRDNAKAISGMLVAHEFRTQLLESPGSPPAVFGERTLPGARHTLLIYAHYDGQPVDASAWASPPWKPTLRDAPLESGGREVPMESLASRPGPLPPEWRLYARSASDDKAPIVAILAAIDALRDAGVPLSVNLKLFFEGEEEAGSPHLEAMLVAHAARLASDAILFCDGPVHQSRRMLVFYGARGVTELEMTVYGPLRALHSGHYGNWAPNPIVELSHLIDGMRDTDGHIRIAGFYDDLQPLGKTERQAIAESPEVETELRSSLGLAWNEGGKKRLVERLLLPALNLRGIQGGAVGDKAANAIPTEATASIDFRLVPNQTPERVRTQVEAHLVKQGCWIVHEAPDLAARRAHARIVKLQWGSGYPAARTSMDLPVSRAVARVAEESVGQSIVRLPTLGGSVPMHVFVATLHAPIIGVPIVNHDNNQHAKDENLRLQNLWDGIELFAGLLARLGESWQ